jgi:phage shock protein B
MPPEYLVPIFIVFIVVGLPVMAATLISLAKIMKGQSGGKGERRFSSDREEAEIMQEIHHSVSRLEKRIDALETIVLEKSSSPRNR